MYQKQIEKVSQNATVTYGRLEQALEEKQALRQQLKEAMNEAREARATIAAQRDEIAQLNADIYAMHLEQLDTLKKFQVEEDKRRGLRQHLSKNPNVRHNLDVLREASSIEDKTYDDFMKTLPNKMGFLMKLRLGGFRDFVVKNKSKKRFFVLIGDTLYHAPKKESPRSMWQSIRLCKYESIALDEKVLRLVPKPGAGLSARSYELSRVDTAIDEQEDLVEWTRAINDRIAISTYLNETRNEPPSSRCLELVNFIADPTRTTLLVQDRACDLHRALAHFCRSLSMRGAGLRCIELDNVALTDESVDVLASIIVHNSHVQRLVLPCNLITAKGAKKLAEALVLGEGDAEPDLQLIDLTDNNIGDAGVSRSSLYCNRTPVSILFVSEAMASATLAFTHCVKRLWRPPTNANGITNGPPLN